MLIAPLWIIYPVPIKIAPLLSTIWKISDSDICTEQMYEPCPFESGLKKFALDPVVVTFFKKLQVVVWSSRCIFFAKNIYVVKITSSDLIISGLVIFTT